MTTVQSRHRQAKARVLHKAMSGPLHYRLWICAGEPDRMGGCIAVTCEESMA